MILENNFFITSDKELLEKLIFSIDIPIIVFNEEKRILFANERLFHYTKIKPEILLKNQIEITSERIKDHFYFFTTNIKLLDENNKEIQIPLNISPFEYKDKIYYLGTIHESYYDSLTGFPTISIFELNLEKIIASSRRRNKTFAILFVDLDKFKFINDTYGHIIGDQIIQKISKILESSLRIDDFITRKGGDEFIILLNDLASKEDIHYVIEKIFSFFKEPIQIDNQKIPLTLSIGISIFPDDADNGKDLIKKADYAMYKAKEINKNSFAFYSSELEKELKHKHRIETQLIQDYKDNFKNFEIVFQPILSQIEENRFSVESLEVFFRWQYENQYYDTNTVLEIAKKKSFIFEIDKFVIIKIIEFIKKHKFFSYPIHLNISSRMFFDINFISFLKETLNEYNISSKMIVLEIMENTLNKDINYSLEIIKELKQNSFSICIDDFGSGNTNLFLLYKIKPDFLKIHFNNKALKDIKLLYDIIDTLYFSLKSKIIINKIEDLNLLKEILRSKKILYFQGFFFSQPLSEKQLIQYLEKGLFYEF